MAKDFNYREFLAENKLTKVSKGSENGKAKILSEGIRILKERDTEDDIQGMIDNGWKRVTEVPVFDDILDDCEVDVVECPHCHADIEDCLQHGSSFYCPECGKHFEAGDNDCVNAFLDRNSGWEPDEIDEEEGMDEACFQDEYGEWHCDDRDEDGELLIPDPTIDDPEDTEEPVDDFSDLEVPGLTDDDDEPEIRGVKRKHRTFNPDFYSVDDLEDMGLDDEELEECGDLEEGDWFGNKKAKEIRSGLEWYNAFRRDARNAIHQVTDGGGDPEDPELRERAKHLFKSAAFIKDKIPEELREFIEKDLIRLARVYSI